MDTNWTIEVVPSANREIRALRSEMLKREALEMIVDLREDATPIGAKALRGPAGYYRIAFGSHRYRIVYQVIIRKRLIRNLRVRRRRDAYKSLK